MSAKPYKWKKKFCKELTVHMAKGYSIEAFAGDIDVTKDCIYKWIERHPEFKEAHQKGKAKQHKFFEGMGIHGMTGKLKNFNASTYIFTMKNKLGWVDKVEIDAEVETRSVVVNIAKSTGKRTLEEIENS